MDGDKFEEFFLFLCVITLTLFVSFVTIFTYSELFFYIQKQNIKLEQTKLNLISKDQCELKNEQ